jgi:hypothetical protein
MRKNQPIDGEALQHQVIEVSIGVVLEEEAVLANNDEDAGEEADAFAEVGA